jgi:hypothetical protein
MILKVKRGRRVRLPFQPNVVVTVNDGNPRQRSRNSGGIRGCAAVVAVGAIVSILAACGGGGKVALTARNRPHQAAGSSLPLPVATARRLPPGVFYLLSGPNPLSGNLWEVSSSGHEIQLTYNRANFGISSFGATRAGIVMADASSGVDELVQLTSHGIVPLPGNHVASPVVNDDGEIAAVRPPGNIGPKVYFDLVIKKSFNARPHTIYRQHASLGGLAWGPGGSVGVLSSSHPPGTRGPDSSLLIVDHSGSAHRLSTDFTQLSEVVWGERAPAVAVAHWNGAGEVVFLNGTRKRLPSGWWPVAWNATGTQLLVRTTGNPGTLGVWSLKNPAQVTRIGDMNQHMMITEAAWLRSKASLHPA